MLKNNDVPTMMTRVQTALAKAARSRPPKQLVVISEATRDDIGISALRRDAKLVIEFHSGSARPVVGPGVRFAKRAMRRLARWYVGPIAEQQSRFNTASLDIDERLLAQQESLITGVQQVREQLEQIEERLDDIAADAETADVAPSGEDVADLAPSIRRKLDYAAFEDLHRGSDVDVKALLSPYVHFFQRCTKVVDLGCGRGEFLALLADAHVSAYGVDVDPDMVARCASQGLDVVQGDAIAHLRSLSPGEVDGVFASQVVEHLSTKQMVVLLDLAFRKLRPGGILVLETPNPETLFVFSGFFYADLTHVRPVHPEALRWACEAAGFIVTDLLRSQPVPAPVRLEDVPAASGDGDVLAVVARNTERLNDVLFGPQHYAVVARKPEEDL